jgi:hypothetical protein
VGRIRAHGASHSGRSVRASTDQCERAVREARDPVARVGAERGPLRAPDLRVKPCTGQLAIVHVVEEVDRMVLRRARGCGVPDERRVLLKQAFSAVTTASENVVQCAESAGRPPLKWYRFDHWRVCPFQVNCLMTRSDGVAATAKVLPQER